MSNSQAIITLGLVFVGLCFAVVFGIIIATVEEEWKKRK